MGRRLAAIAVAAVCLLTAGYLAASERDADQLRHAEELGLTGDYAGALAAARRVDVPPQDGRALAVQAYALQAMRRGPEASTMFARAVARDPNNWVLHRDWGVLLAGLGRRAQAGREIGRALRLNPGMPLPPGFSPPARSPERAR